MKSFEQLKQDQFLKKPSLKKAYTDLNPHDELARQIIDARLKKGFSQAQLAKKIGTGQSSIARLESGDYNPSLKFLERVADATDSRLSVKLKS